MSRAEVLVTAARLLQEAWPELRRVKFWMNQEELDEPALLARFDWPGVVVVVRSTDGVELLRSKVGLPFSLDEADPTGLDGCARRNPFVRAVT